MNHRQLNKGCGTLDRLFVVLGQSSRPIEPAKGSLHDPTLGLNHESFLLPERGNDFQRPGPAASRPRHGCPIRRIDPHYLGRLHMASKLRQGLLAALGILDRCWSDDQRPQQAQRINYNMTLATVDFFSPRRSLWARLARWSSRSGYRGWLRSAWVFCRPAGAPAPVIGRGSGSRYHLSASNGSNETQCGMAVNHEVTHATRDRCESDRRWHSQSLGGNTLPVARRPLVWGPERQWPAIAHRSSPLGKTSVSWPRT